MKRPYEKGYMKKTVGGGPKKVLYTLNTVRRIGLLNSAKALSANNSCKACGLGMGGQQGGMTNELGEFPSVCNKSVQAQSTDIQAPIPSEVFEHSLGELRELTPRELETVGRLANPVFKAKGTDKYQEVEWDWALDFAAQQFSKTPAERSFFYSSGRSSNEAGFVLQLLARVYGTNNVTNCSYYCHQATSVGLASTIGTGTSTVELNDLSGCDLVFVIGANPASNHPRFIHQLKNCRDRGGQVIVINPAKEAGLVKFAVPKSPSSMLSGGTEIASHYLQPKIGSDIALFKGIAKAIIELGAQNKAYIEHYCQQYEIFEQDIEATSWKDIQASCGIDKAQITQAAKLYSESKNTVFAWGMGMTHHTHGSENVEYIANIALLRGMIGKQYAGLLPLRGHSNVQGIGTIGVKPVLAEEVMTKMETELQVSLPRTAGLDTLSSLQQAAQGNMDCVCIVGGNLYSASPDSAWTEKAMNQVGFKMFLTTTLNQGHLYGVDDGETLIFPVAARDEEAQSTTQESMFNFVRLSDGGIERIKNVRSEVTILSGLAQRLMPESPVKFSEFGDHESIRQTIAKVVPGMEELADIGVAKKEFHVNGRLMHTPQFRTETKQASFVVHPIPTLNPKPEQYPFLLASVRSEGQFNSIIYEETDSYRNNAHRNTVFMSEPDMQNLKLNTGDLVNVVSANGRMNKVTVQLFDLPKGSLMAYYPEANVLAARTVDPRSKTPNFKSLSVAIEPI